MRYYISIDPGIEGTGWAVWDANDEWNMAARPVAYGVITPGQTKDEDSGFVAKSDRVINKLVPVLTHYSPEKCWCEFPKLMESNHAATATGNIFKLAYFVGRVGQLCQDRSCTFIPVDVNHWKGEMKKPAVDKRIERVLAGAAYPNHASDAVGIGLWAKGVWSSGKGKTITRTPSRAAEGRVVALRKVSARNMRT